MKKSIIVSMLCLLVLTACNLPSSLTPTPNLVESQVALLLTQIPSATATNKIQNSPIPTTAIPSTTTNPITLTATSTQTSTLTPTLLPSATSAPADLIASLGTPSWKNPANWKGFYLNGSDSEVTITQSNNNLVLTALHADGWYGWSLSYIKGKNFYLEGTFKVGSCSGLDRYGLIFRAPDTSQGYFFGVSCDGQYSLRTFVSGSFSKTNIVDWTQSDSILTGPNQVNRIGVLVKDNNYSLYINGKLISTKSDDTFSAEGIFGAYIASINTVNLTVSVQAMDFWNLP
jgi:hypothetical protein